MLPPRSYFAFFFFLAISLPSTAEEAIKETEGPSNLVELRKLIKDWSKKSNQKLKGALTAKVENVETYSSIRIRVDCTRHLRRSSTVDGRPRVMPYWEPNKNGFIIFVHTHDGVIIGKRKSDEELLKASRIKWTAVNEFSGTLARDTPRGFSVGISGEFGSNLEVSRRQLIFELIGDLAQKLCVSDRFEDVFFGKLKDPLKTEEQEAADRYPAAK